MNNEWYEEDDYHGYWRRDEEVGDLRLFLHASRNGWYVEIDGPDISVPISTAKEQVDAFSNKLRTFLESLK
jgi:hypothetical protein